MSENCSIQPPKNSEFILGKILLGGILIFLISCGGSKKEDDGSRVDPDKEKLIEKLTLFVEEVQGEHYDRAFEYLSPREKAKMFEGSSEATPLVRRQLKALRLSTLAHKAGVHLDHGKIEGIYEWLPNFGSAKPPVDSTAPSNIDQPLLP